MKDYINNYILLSTYYYCRKTEMISNYKCTFSLEGNKSTCVTQKQMSNPREQYGGTVHLFIGTGRSLCIITFMPFTIDYNNDTKHHGSLSQFIFKSVRPFIFGYAIIPKLHEWYLRHYVRAASAEAVSFCRTFGDEAWSQHPT